MIASTCCAGAAFRLPFFDAAAVFDVAVAVAVVVVDVVINIDIDVVPVAAGAVAADIRNGGASGWARSLELLTTEWDGYTLLLLLDKSIVALVDDDPTALLDWLGDTDDLWSNPPE